MMNFFNKVQIITENYLTWKNIRKQNKLEKQKNKHPVLDWIEAFLWAAMVVLLINQYLFQAYQIPSGSMMNTLLIKDRIFVNKTIYGPELIPGMQKLPGFFKPKRGEVIIFENPTYLSRGPVFDVVQRVLYMVTLSLVDIDRDQYGQPRPHFLIKRAVAAGKDRVRLHNGSLQIRPAGVENWIDEKDFLHLNREPAKVRRLIGNDEYQYYRSAAYGTVLNENNIFVDPQQKSALTKLNSSFVDSLTFNSYRAEMKYAIEPFNREYRKDFIKNKTGWYIPENWIFPLGDNRDNSKDGRYFGPVKLKKVLGKAMFKYWPFNRIGQIK